MKCLSTFVAALVASSAQASTDGKCRALVLSGGSNNGAWETGVMWGLAHYGTASDYAWDVVTGVSAGAINTAGIATWAAGTELEMTEWLSQTWQNMSSDQVWQKREGSIPDLLFNQPSFLDDSVGLQTMGNLVASRTGIERRFAVSAVDTNTGEYVAMTNENTTYDELAQSAVSSGSLPGIFQPQHLHGYIFFDGGMIWNVNLVSAIEQCMEIVDDFADIIVDVAVCSYTAQPGDETSKNAYTNFRTANSIHDYYGGTDALYWQERAYPGIDVRYYFQEYNDCPGSGGLDFGNSTTWCLQEAGRQDAKDMLEIGSDNVHKTLEEWHNDKDLKKEYPRFRSYLDEVYGLIFD